MTQRIFPMPKIVWKDSQRAESLDFLFYLNQLDDGSWITAIDKINLGVHDRMILRNPDDFKQSIEVYLSEYVKENFEPIVLPDEIPTSDIMPELFYARTKGYNSFREVLLELNPNAIRISE